MQRNYTVDEIKTIAGEIAKRHDVERMFLTVLPFYNDYHMIIRGTVQIRLVKQSLLGV
ncbi:MAG: hypothetical protein VB106_00990 [Clostridiaceae bacterium]|nr:hypothetical protein [Clostridiaceae bacterium]